MFSLRHDVDRSSEAPLSLLASASPTHHLEVQDSWPAVEATLRIAVGTRFGAKGTIAGAPARPPEGTGSGLDTEADSGNIELDLEDTEFDLVGIGRQDIVLGVRAAGKFRPVAASVGPYNRPEGLSGYCTRVLAAGYRLALLLLPWASRPPHFSLAHHLREPVLLLYPSFAI